MSVPDRAMEALNSHWAVSLLSTEDRRRVDKLVRRRQKQLEKSDQVGTPFVWKSEHETLLQQATILYEVAASEALDELRRPTKENQELRDQVLAASFRVFDIRRHLPVPCETLHRLFFVLQFSATAYCGGRQLELPLWYRQQSEAIKVPVMKDEEREHRLLFRLFDCWMRLFQNPSSDDFDQIRKIIADFNSDLGLKRPHCMENISQEEVLTPEMALLLVGLANWAAATELLANYIQRGEPSDPLSTLHEYFEKGLDATSESGDFEYELAIRWLRAAAHIMVTSSSWWTK